MRETNLSQSITSMANCLPAFLGGVIIGFLMVCGGTLAQEGIPAGASSAVKFLKEARVLSLSLPVLQS